jgi:MFS transporter, AAHS family, 4-hydroxybenzoate transporter
MQSSGSEAELILEARALGALRVRTILLCFLAVVMDGYDTAAVGFASPSIAGEWGLSPAAFTPAFVGTSIGAVLGFVFAGALARRFGHRLVMLGSLVWFGGSSLLTLTADSITSLTAIRFVTALGLGSAVPIAIALASEYSKKRYRELAATIVGMGFGLGVVIGGIVAKPLLANYSWSAIFLAGGLAPLVAFPLFWAWLPESLQIAITRFRHAASTSRMLQRLEIPAAVLDGVATETPGVGPRKSIVAEILAPGLRQSTSLLWTFAFLIFMNTYMFTFWTPLLLTNVGFSAAEAAIGPTAFGAGGLIGAILAMPAIARFGVTRVLVITSLIGAAAVAVLGLVELERQGILLTLAVAGAGLAFGNIGQGAAAVSIYAPDIRATGIGCSAAVGRIGGILGPALAGALLYLDWPVQHVILTACIPSVLAAAAMFALTANRKAHLREHQEARPAGASDTVG